jgi:hypothetical protein
MSRRWIDEPELLGIGNPTDTELEDLYHEGFRTIISLLNEDEQSPHYDIEIIKAMGFRRYSIPGN